MFGFEWTLTFRAQHPHSAETIDTLVEFLLELLPPSKTTECLAITVRGATLRAVMSLSQRGQPHRRGKMSQQ